MFKFLSNGAASAIEKVATEWIQTDKEKAEAASLMVKTLDPNGLMRRQISMMVSKLYALYILITLLLLLCQAFGMSPTIYQAGTEHFAVDIALDNITQLFVPITTAFGAIVSASFGVQGVNAAKNR